MILFFKVFFAEFIAEMGDKTQLMLIALTSKYKLRDIILGTGVAILVLNGLAVLAGGTCKRVCAGMGDQDDCSTRIPLFRRIHDCR